MFYDKLLVQACMLNDKHIEVKVYTRKQYLQWREVNINRSVLMKELNSFVSYEHRGTAFESDFQMFSGLTQFLQHES